jgi:flagellar biosynthesis/type III secretory pathway M-ring protein FliF/YscJ
VYLIPVIAALVVIAAFVLLLVVMCERRRRRQRERHRRQTYEETAKWKRRDSEDADGVKDSFTELRDIEPKEIDVSVIEPTERALFPARSPREHGARDE